MGKIEIAGHGAQEISYHVMLLHESGLLKATDSSDFGEFDWKQCVTYEGHEFIEAAKSDTVWHKAKESVIRSTGTLIPEALTLAVSATIKSLIAGSGV